MPTCVTASADSLPLAPNKRVHYSFGMVLGVDEFRQEQEHLEWKQRLSNLLLHGYGTVCGLGVSAAAQATEVEIRVASGYALSPHGRWIWVDRDQCAQLNAWLRASRAEQTPPLSAGRQRIYVKLCYVECEVDLVPIAGTTCADEEATRAPSRTLESFRIEFAWEPPPQLAEEAVRSFGTLLSSVSLSPSGGSSPDDSAALLEAVRALGLPVASPPASPPEPPPLQLAEATACATMQEALTIWTTEVCPRLELPTSAADCILLACIEFDTDAAGDLVFTVDAAGALDPASVAVDNCVRPVLVSDRLKQELFCLGMDASTANPGTGEPGPAGPGMIARGVADFTAEANGAWGQHMTQIVPIDLAEPGPITMMVTAFTPSDFYNAGGNVALTAVLLDNRVAIAATNLAEARLARLQVSWWAFQP